jgi:hypothetical protein
MTLNEPAKRYCRHCGKELVKRPHMAMKNWLKQRNCSRLCAYQERLRIKSKSYSTKANPLDFIDEDFA